MTDAPKVRDRSAPLSVRFSDAEKARLAQLASGQPLGQYIRERVLGSELAPRRAVRAPLKDADALGQALALLGRSRLASNLKQIAKAANQGSLPVTAELEADLRLACSQVFEMRCLLLRALGVHLVSDAIPLSGAFAQAAEELQP
ncbi:plasmid mobilization protein [Rhodopseudomonas sp.]|uniref:plasmid mobilization protein n=1 Tax=Rhodopseudomonas sp. TaxID=1078 RepID=UPI003B3A16AE